MPILSLKTGAPKQLLEKLKSEAVVEDVKKVLPHKTAELDLKIKGFEKRIQEKKKEKLRLLADVKKRPFIRKRHTRYKQYPYHKTTADGVTIDSVIRRKEVEKEPVQNPNFERIPKVEAAISLLYTERDSLLQKRSTIREDLESDVLSKYGVLQELVLFLRFVVTV